MILCTINYANVRTKFSDFYQTNYVRGEYTYTTRDIFAFQILELTTHRASDTVLFISGCCIPSAEEGAGGKIVVIVDVRMLERDVVSNLSANQPERRSLDERAQQSRVRPLFVRPIDINGIADCDMNVLLMTNICLTEHMRYRTAIAFVRGGLYFDPDLALEADSFRDALEDPKVGQGVYWQVQEGILGQPNFERHHHSISGNGGWLAKCAIECGSPYLDIGKIAYGCPQLQRALPALRVYGRGCWDHSFRDHTSERGMNHSGRHISETSGQQRLSPIWLGTNQRECLIKRATKCCGIGRVGLRVTSADNNASDCEGTDSLSHRVQHRRAPLLCERNIWLEFKGNIGAARLEHSI